MRHQSRLFHWLRLPTLQDPLWTVVTIKVGIGLQLPLYEFRLLAPWLPDLFLDSICLHPLMWSTYRAEKGHPGSGLHFGCSHVNYAGRHRHPRRSGRCPRRLRGDFRACRDLRGTGSRHPQFGRIRLRAPQLLDVSLELVALQTLQVHICKPQLVVGSSTSSAGIEMKTIFLRVPV